MSGLIVKPWYVTVDGYGSAQIVARSRGKALADAWRSDAFQNVSFKDFLRIATARQVPAGDRFREPITVGGRLAFYIGCNRQYIRFVRPDSDVVLNSHPYDVEPPEARRGTPYYVEPRP